MGKLRQASAEGPIHPPQHGAGGPRVPPRRVPPCHRGRPGSWQLLHHRSSTVTSAGSRCQHNQGTNLLNLIKSLSSAVPLERKKKNIYKKNKNPFNLFFTQIGEQTARQCTQPPRDPREGLIPHSGVCSHADFSPLPTSPARVQQAGGQPCRRKG